MLFERHIFKNVYGNIRYLKGLVLERKKELFYFSSSFWFSSKACTILVKLETEQNFPFCFIFAGSRLRRC